MPDEPNAASSTATATVETPQENADMTTWSDEQRSEWLKSGDLPKAEATPPKSSEPSPDEKAAAEAKTEPASEPGKQQEPHPATGEKRKGQLANEIQQLLKQRAELRQENTRLLTEKAGKTTATPAEPAASELKEPNADDFTGEHAWEDYQKAIREYNRRETQRLIQEALESDRAERAATAAAEAAEKQNRKIESDWSKRIREFKAGHPEAKDFEPTVQALADSGLIPENSFLDQWILYSENGPALVWYFSQNADEILRIGELHPIAASRELAKLEESLNGNKKVPVSSQSPTVPKPPATVTARSAAPADELEAAIASGDKTGDARAYIDAANRREFAARKG